MEFSPEFGIVQPNEKERTMKSLLIMAILVLGANAMAENHYNRKTLGTCEVVELDGAVAEVETWVNEDEEGIERGIGIDIDHPPHRGLLVFSDEKYMKVKDKEDSFTVRLRKPLLGFGFNSGKLKIDKDSGEGTLWYTDRCWDWGACGVTKYSYTLKNCHLDYNWEIPSGYNP